MSGELYSVAGAKFYIGNAAFNVPASGIVAATDFASVTWLEVDGYENMGAAADAAAEVATDLINRGRTIVQKGTARAPARTDQFAILPVDAGQIALLAASQPTNKANYPFKILFDDDPPVRTAVATVTIASPGVFTVTGHGLVVGDGVKFTTTGALPTGITAGTTYYVKTVLTADTFTVAATSGGTVINTSGTQSGVHTMTTVPTATIKYWAGLVMNASEQGGGANTTRLLSATIAPNTNYATVAPTGVYTP